MSIPFDKPAKSIAIAGSPVNLREIKAHCLTCSVRELCLPVGVGTEGLHQINALVVERRHLRKGETLYRAGEPFSALHAIRVGSCKTTVLGEQGHEQIAGFHLIGDIVGLDGLGTERYRGEAVALEDTEVCVLPFDRLEELARDVVPLQHNLHKVLATEIAREREVMLLLGSMRAEERIAVFLLNLSRRYKQRGYSPSEFVLRLSRAEIGSYLGLKLETVSRQLTRFQAAGLIQIQGRVVKLLDLPGLQHMIGEQG